MRIDSGEVKRADLRQVEPRERRDNALRIQKRVLDRKLHVGRGELRDEGAVDVLDHRMHDRLRMDEDVDRIRRHPEEVMGFDDLETFVHHGRGVDRNLVAHFPGRMRERVGDGDVSERCEIAPQKWSARRREHDPLHLGVTAAAKGLMHGVVLGVDGKDFAAVLRRGARHDVAGGDEHFLVGDTDAFARFERRVNRRNAGGSDDGGDDRIRTRQRRDRGCAFRAADDLDATFQSRPQRSDIVSTANRNNFRRVPLDLLREQLEIPARRKADYAQRIRKRVDDVERRASDGTGGAEDGDLAHL